MSLHRFAPRRDANEARIIARFRALGCVVVQLSGAGMPDLLVSLDGVLHLVEVKDGPKKKLTPVQERWHRNWKLLGGAWPYVVHDEGEVGEMVARWKAVALEQRNSTPRTIEDDMGQWHDPDSLNPLPETAGKTEGEPA